MNGVFLQTDQSPVGAWARPPVRRGAQATGPRGSDG